jgi:general L-amino acid transport system permease protein
MMMDFVRQTLVTPRMPPIAQSGLARWLTYVLRNPVQAGLTLLGLVVLALVLVPSVRFLLIDATWMGTTREACVATQAQSASGACWPFVGAKFAQFMYGFYPEAQRWRPNVVFALAIILLVPLLIPRVPGKTLNAILFFAAFPVLAFFLLYGGGLSGFGVAAISAILASLENLFNLAAMRLYELGGHASWMRGLFHAMAYALELMARAFNLTGSAVDAFQEILDRTKYPFWTDFLISATCISLALLLWLRTARALLWSAIGFALAAAFITMLQLDQGGLMIVDTRQWGGFLVTLIVSVTGIVASMPIGMALALGRRSRLPVLRAFSIAFIEFWRGVPLITVLFFATYMLPLFMPGGTSMDGLLRVLIGVALFAGAYNAEVIRGGLEAVPQGQSEAARALGLSDSKATALIVMPQALRHVIPGLVNSFIALFKDTTLVMIVAIFDLLGQLRAAFADPNWLTPSTLFTGFAFVGAIYFIFSFGMSRYAIYVEHRLNAHQSH